jgi:transposase
MARGKYVVRLAEDQRAELRALVRRKGASPRKATRARILLKADAGWDGTQIAAALDITPATVCAIKRRFVQEGMGKALEERPRPGQRPKLDARGEAHLIALACSDAPGGHEHWTLRLLAGKVVELGVVPSISHETVRQRLKKAP